MLPNPQPPTPSPYRLVCIRGAHAGVEWPLRLDRATIIGRHAPDGGSDVDLSPDRRVSRRHARVWFEDGRWWLQDLESRHGTTLGRVRLAGGGRLWCEPGAPIVLGKTTLTLFAPHWFRFVHGSLTIDVGLSPAINEAILWAHAMAVTRLVVGNVSQTRTAEAGLLVELGTLGSGRATIPALEPGESHGLPLPALDGAADGRPIEGEARWQPVTVAVDGELLRRDDAGLWVLPFDAWSRAPEHRVSLAAFVLPTHPAVAQVARAATAGCPGDTSPCDLLAAVYRHLADDWHLDYRRELPGADGSSQRVRLPDQVLLDAIGRQGHGTCLDLALLVAGCLEHLRVQPVLALVDLGATWHALVGCWERSGPRLEPVIGDAPRLLRRAIWLDPTGCTRDPACRAAFEGSRAAAEGCLRDHALVCAVDVAAARGDGVRSLPVRREPPWSAAVASAIVRARAVALAAGTRLAMVPLLIGVLLDRSGLTSRVLGLGDEPPTVLERVRAGLPAGSAEAPPSRHYLEALAGARMRAELDGNVCVEEHHLLSAMLSQRSAALEAALASLGTDRATAERALHRFAPGAMSGSGDRSVFVAEAGPRVRKEPLDQ